MIDGMFSHSTLPMLEQVVNFTESRHGVLAGNIANLDTPGYKTRDLSPTHFQERLKEAVRESYEPASAAAGVPPWSRGQAPRADDTGDPFARVDDDLNGLLMHDGNNVGLEQQITQIAKNQQQHNLAINIMSQQYRLLRAVIQERVA